MNINNAKLMYVYRTLLVIGAIFLMIAIAFLHIVFNIKLLSVVGGLLIIVFFLFNMKIKQIFEYNSEGEVLIFKNKNIFVSQRNRYIGLDEFPKRLFCNYKLRRTLLKKKLYISIKAKSRVVTLNYNVTFVNAQKLKRLEADLRRQLLYSSNAA